MALYLKVRPKPIPKINAAELTANDPKPDYKLPKESHQKILELSGSSSKNILLVYVGDCASCIATDFRKWESLAAERNIAVVFLTSANRAEAKKFIAILKLKSKAFSDTDEQLINALNASWIPRYYLFSPEGRLLWKQPAPQKLDDPFADTTFPNLKANGRRQG